MARAFKRTLTLTVVKPTGFFSQSPNNAIVIRSESGSDLRVQFKVEKHLGKNPNTGEVIVSNLSERTRVEMETKPLHITLEAGYDGGTSRVFVGDLRFSRSEWKGTEWETRIQIGDGERAVRHARVNRSYRGGVTAADAVRELAKAMGLTAPANVRDLKRQYVGGLSLFGPASSQLDNILTPLGRTWSIQDGQLQILRATEVRRNTAHVLSTETGIKGVPELGAPESAKKPAILHLRNTLRPDILPGSKIQVNSRQFNAALFKVLRVEHVGDTHGDAWDTVIEARAL